MRTAEEWVDEYSWTGITPDEVKAIQFDAWKKGMLDAMKVRGKGLARANIAAAMTNIPKPLKP